jgi:hypothetical protein
MQLIILGVYAILLLALFLMSLFIIYHIVRYAYSKPESMLMLLIFIPVTSIFFFIQIVLFFSIRFDEIFYFLS